MHPAPTSRLPMHNILRRGTCFVSLAVVLLLAFPSLGQGPITAPIPWQKPLAFPNIPGVQYFLGGRMFVPTDNDSIFVRFLFSSAWWGNVLYFMHPDSAPGRDTVRVFGFDECRQEFRAPVNPQTRQIELRKFLGVFNRFRPNGDTTELVFMLKTVQQCNECPNATVCRGTSCGPRFTGFNNPAVSRYYSRGPYASLANHVWAVMGELSDAQATTLLDAMNAQNVYPYRNGGTHLPLTRGGVIFGYEDGCNETWDDMIFYVEGASLTLPRQLLLNVSDATVQAGQKLDVKGYLLLEGGDTIRTDSSIYQYVSWRILPTTAQSGDSLLPRQGQQASFIGTRAFRNRTIEATFRDPAHPDQPLTATAVITVVPGPDYQVVIEITSKNPITNQADILPKTYNDSTTARPISLIALDSAQNTAYAYAVVRDRYGNIKRVASNAQWSELPPPGAVSVSGTSGKLWEGVITRTGSGDDSIRAWEASPLILVPDTVKVSAQAGVLIGLRLVDENGNPVTAININTDQAQYLRVQGQWSDKPGQWVDFPAQWSMTPPIPSANAMPTTDATNWTFSPTAPGTANLTVANATRSKSVTVPVTVTPAPPSRVEIKLVDQAPIAGTPFRVEVRIYNTDGLVPGVWCYPGNMPGQVAYQDILMKPGQYPRVSTDYDSDTLNRRPDTTHRVSECFNDGVDTINVTLFYAPQSPDSNHQLWVRMYGATGYIEGSTQPFRLLPGPVDRIYLADGQGNLLPSSMALSAPTGILYAISMGVDAYGNLIGAVQSGWSSDGNLHPPAPGPSPSLFYPTTTVLTAENGCIIATATQNPAARDTICLTIAAPPAYVTTAWTRDTSGNGYLDRIEVHFNKPVTITDATPLTNVIVTYHGRTVDYPFTVADIVSLSGKETDTIFYIELTELQNGIPQTGWVPTIQFVNIKDVITTEVTCADGAGPVVWSVVKDVKNVDDHTTDIVTVTFSETLDRTPGANDVPGVIFEVWTRNADGSFSDADALLEGIGFFLISSKNDVAKFQMVNGQNLTSSNYLSIRVQTPPVVVDGSAQNNAPSANNQKVQVQVNSAMIVKSAPNPMVPTGLRPNDTRLVFKDPALVAKWAYEDNGTAFLVAIPLPSDSMMTLEGELLVYDVAGNLVHYRPSNGPIDLREWKANWAELAGKTQYFGIYWNGLNDQRMKCSPGVYRALVKLTATYQFQGVRTSKRLNQVVAIGVRK